MMGESPDNRLSDCWNGFRAVLTGRKEPFGPNPDYSGRVRFR